MNDEQKAAQWRLGRNIMIVAFIFGLVWASVLVEAVLMGRESSALSGMFDSVLFFLWGVILVLVTGKGWKDFASLKWGRKGGE